MKLLNTLTSNAYHDLIDYNVVDQSGDHVGTLHSLWSDQNSGQLEFLGVKTGWLFGKNHVVPAASAQIDEDNRFVQIPFAADFIKEAPSIAADAEITEDQEAEIYRYYGMSGFAGATAATSTTTTTPDTTINDLGRTTAAATGASFTGAAATTTGAGTADYAATTASATTTTTREAHAGETIEVPVSEEQLRVGKREVETGSVRLRKVIRTEIVNQPVELRREEVIVERIPASEVRAGSATAFEGEEIVIPVRHEEAVVAKDTVVTGAVRVEKRSESETHNVSDTVRKEDVEVDRGTVVAGSTGAATATTGYAATTGGKTASTSTGYAASGDVNPDLVTGEPGSHPVGTAIGGLSGAATGAAIGGAGAAAGGIGAAAMGATFGAAAGPVGAVIGGIAGAVVGGLVGKGVEEFFDPTEEAAYWKENYRSSSSYDPSMSYEDYEPAYRSGYTGFGKYYGEGKRFEDVESDIRRDYEGSGSRLGYDKARSHIKEAYDRIFNRAASGQRRSS